MKDNIIEIKSYKFALRIIKLYNYLINNKKEYVLSKQVLRSGTSIGANIAEASSGQSRKDFIAKFSISQKEAYETRYWLNLFIDSEIIERKYMQSLINECEELIKIITKIIVTSKKSI